jgi:hypothetical protein
VPANEIIAGAKSALKKINDLASFRQTIVRWHNNISRSVFGHCAKHLHRPHPAQTIVAVKHHPQLSGLAVPVNEICDLT